MRPYKVLAALNHAARTFQSFTAEDWRAMAAECSKQADSVSCIDCGRDLSMPAVGTQPPSPKQHRLARDGRWTCGVKEPTNG